MSTKTKGDILAERIEQIAAEIRKPYPSTSAYLSEAVADYRKPWTLGRSVNGFTLGDGQEWHRNDWTEDMLPDGWRPLIKGEYVNSRDFEYLCEGYWLPRKDYYYETDTSRFARTKSPLPPVIDPYAELKAAFKAGKTIQMSFSESSSQWFDIPRRKTIEFTAPVSRYRIKPAPKLVPLGPEDVPPGSVIRYIRRIHGYEWLALRGLPVDGSGVELANGALLSFELLKEKCEISRDNGKTWERCEKEAK